MNEAQKTPLASAIEREIAAKGPIPFSRFMGVWLQGTQNLPGFYAGGVEIGFEDVAKNDFVTSPETSKLFGILLAKLMVKMRYTLPDPQNLHIYEMGAGNGTLAKSVLLGLQIYDSQFASFVDILSGRQGNMADLAKAKQEIQQIDPEFDPLFSDIPIAPNLLRGVSYTVIDSSDKLLSIQRQNLADLPVNFHLAPALSDLEDDITHPGIFISNELVDALPVEIVRRQNKRWEQLFIGNGNAYEFSEQWLKPTEDVTKFISDYQLNVKEGKLLPLNLESVRWLTNIVRHLPAGYIVTIDYGGITKEVATSSPIRRYASLVKGGRVQTASTYAKDVTGLTDMTADVNFAVLKQAGEALGLKTIAYMNQGDLLSELGFDSENLNKDPFIWFWWQNAHHFDELMKTPMITKPDLLRRFRGFKVLIQSKDMPDPTEWYRHLQLSHILRLGVTNFEKKSSDQSN